VSAQEEYEAIQAIQGGIRKAVNAGIDHEEIALQIQEGFAEIGLQAVCDIKVVGSLPAARTGGRKGGRKKKPKTPRV
jgi:hypothetical protein